VSLDYRSAGVDIDAADEARRRIRKLVESTYTEGTRGEFGAFGGMFRVPQDAKAPVLVASADSVGTKIKVAIEAGRHDTIGHCLVNHCVNDILVQGARPLFFLDYVAFGVLVPEVAEGIVTGVANGCRENGCALLGGETAELPGLYTPPDYDLAGFVVGLVEEDAVVGPHRVKNGDVLVALESSGLHTNGYSLARRIVSERLKLAPDDPFPNLGASTADALLAVHRSSLSVLRPHLPKIHSLAHITGGGIPGNLNRALPPGLDARVETGSWKVPPLFETLVSAGGVERGEAFRAFNMGVGMIAVLARDAADELVSAAGAAGVRAWVAGDVISGDGEVHLIQEADK
jgi:phosphoribosylformylglycinamidine cyclo-ligase